MQLDGSNQYCDLCGLTISECQCETRASGANVTKNQSNTSNENIWDGKYLILGELGKGGMGIVYKAEHLLLQTTVALKVVNKNLLNEKKLLMRFHQEARACASLKHKNIVSVFDCALTESEQPYFSMEYVEGNTLSKLIDDGLSKDLNRTINIFMQIADGLEYAHEHKVIHRDLKPPNLILTNDKNAREILKIVDFGIARVEGPGGQIETLTNTGEILGSPKYMSPEQCKGDTIDHRVDIYSLGCIMFHALSGQPPFQGENSMTVLMAHIEADPPQLEITADGAPVPEKLKVLILKCLEKNPDDRPQNMSEIKEALKQIQTELNSQKKYLPRKIVLYSIVVLLLAGIICGTVFFSTRGDADDVKNSSLSTERLKIDLKNKSPAEKNLIASREISSLMQTSLRNFKNDSNEQALLALNEASSWTVHLTGKEKFCVRARINIQRGLIEMRMTRWDKAEYAFRRSLELFDKGPDICHGKSKNIQLAETHRHLSRLHSKRGKNELSYKEMKTAYDLVVQDKSASSIVNQFQKELHKAREKRSGTN